MLVSRRNGCPLNSPSGFPRRYRCHHALSARQDLARLREDVRQDMKDLESRLRDDMKRLDERVARVEHSQANLEGLLEGLCKAITHRNVA